MRSWGNCMLSGANTRRVRAIFEQRGKPGDQRKMVPEIPPAVGGWFRSSYTRALTGFSIPPTEVGGLFRSNLQASTDRVLESHQRKLVDCLDPASETKGSNTLKIEFHDPFYEPSPNCRWRDSEVHQHFFCRLDLNNPPTSVGGIPSF